MDWKKTLGTQDLNWWTVISGMGMNLILTVFLLFGIAALSITETGEILITLVMSLGGFLIPLFTALICGRISGEKFLAYAFYPLIGFLIPVVPGIVVGGGMMAVLMVAFGVLGAFNGATIAARNVMKRRQRIKHLVQDSIEEKES